MKPFAVPRACTRSKTKRYPYCIFRTDNYTDVIENFQWATYVYKQQNFLKKSSCKFYSFWTTGCPKKHLTFDLMYIENDCTYMICFNVFWIIMLNKFGIKQSKTVESLPSNC